MTRKKRRLYVIVLGMATLGVAAALILTAFEDNLVFFFSPSDLAEKPLAPGQRVRVGGLVEEDSVKREDDGLTVSFRVTDLAAAVPVRFRGVLPDLFREGQGVVIEGQMGANGVFTASEVLAKHDENYMPAEVKEALEASGQWQGDAEP